MLDGPDSKRNLVGECLRVALMRLHDDTMKMLKDEETPSHATDDRPENTTDNPKSLAAWKREAERLEDENRALRVRNRELMSSLSRMAGDA